MVKKLVSKSEFARMAGVGPSAITKAISSGLDAAMDGKRINASHPVAVKYLDEKIKEQQPPPATGIDPLYEQAVAYCIETDRYSISALQRKFKIGYVRAKTIIDTMKGAGIDKMEIEPATATIVKPRKVLRGHGAKNESKKRAASDDDQILEIPENIQAFADMTLRELIEKFGTDIRFMDWLKATKAIEDINEKRLKNAETKGELVSRKLIKLGVIDPIDAAHIKLLTDGSKTIARRAVAMNGAGRTLDDIEKFVADQITSFIRPIKSKVARALRNA